MHPRNSFYLCQLLKCRGNNYSLLAPVLIKKEPNYVVQSDRCEMSRKVAMRNIEPVLVYYRDFLPIAIVNLGLTEVVGEGN
jgi:hypothetical protein